MFRQTRERLNKLEEKIRMLENYLEIYPVLEKSHYEGGYVEPISDVYSCIQDAPKRRSRKCSSKASRSR